MLPVKSPCTTRTVSEPGGRAPSCSGIPAARVIDCDPVAPGVPAGGGVWAEAIAALSDEQGEQGACHGCSQRRR